MAMAMATAETQLATNQLESDASNIAIIWEQVE